MKNLITIGLPSKGRLKDKAIAFFDDKGLKVLQSDKERNYFKFKKKGVKEKILFIKTNYNDWSKWSYRCCHK